MCIRDRAQDALSVLGGDFSEAGDRVRSDSLEGSAEFDSTSFCGCYRTISCGGRDLGLGELVFKGSHGIVEEPDEGQRNESDYDEPGERGKWFIFYVCHG